MSYSWIYLGDAIVPDAQREAWLDASASQAPHGAILGTEEMKSWRLHDPDVTYDSAPVRVVLTALSEEPGAEVRFGSESIVVRVVASKSMDAWLTYRAPLAAAFVLLGRFGGRGTLDVLGASDGPERGYRIESSPEGATARPLTRDEVLALRTSPRFVEAEEASEAASAEVD
jgi:hypothetical protein